MHTKSLSSVLIAALCFSASAHAQQTTTQDSASTVTTKDVATDPCSGITEPESKRLFGIVPNFRTSPCLGNFKPISAGEKFKIATQDSFDRGTFALAAIFGAESQLTNANPSFGSGSAAYGRYLGTAFGDFVIGDYMTEAILPAMLHQDPRYFRKGRGSGLVRLGYACGQIFITHNDSGRVGFNYSEVAGNATAVAISNSYYADNRDAKDASVKLSTQLAVDMTANLLKEFWPDISHKFSRH